MKPTRKVITTPHQLTYALIPFDDAFIIGLDLETTGLNLRHERATVITLSCDTPNERYTMIILADNFEHPIPQVEKLMANPKKVFAIQNANFDLCFLTRMGYSLAARLRNAVPKFIKAKLNPATPDIPELVHKSLNPAVRRFEKLEYTKKVARDRWQAQDKPFTVALPPVFDTMIAYLVLTNGKRAQANLKAIAANLLGVDIDKTLQVSDWSIPQLTDDQIDYAATDAEILLDLLPILSAQLKENCLCECFFLESLTIYPVMLMALEGAPIDLSHLFKLLDDFTIEKAALEKKTLDLFHQHGATKIKNLRSPKQLNEAFIDLGFAKDAMMTELLLASVKVSDIEAFISTHPEHEHLLQPLLDYKYLLNKLTRDQQEEYTDYISYVKAYLELGYDQRKLESLLANNRTSQASLDIVINQRANLKKVIDSMLPYLDLYVIGEQALKILKLDELKALKSLRSKEVLDAFEEIGLTQQVSKVASTIEATDKYALAPFTDNPAIASLLEYKKASTSVSMLEGILKLNLDGALEMPSWIDEWGADLALKNLVIAFDGIQWGGLPIHLLIKLLTGVLVGVTELSIGRIYTSFRAMGTLTGRFASSKPNLQNIPRDKRFRKLIRVAEEDTLIVGDYSQIELVIMASFSQDPRMVEAYNVLGLDIHKLTASVVTGKAITDLTKNDRQLAKSVNFGLVYGMGAPKFQGYAKNSYGVTITLDEAFQYRKTYMETYQGVADHHATMSSLINANEYEIYTNFCRTRSNRRRIFASRSSQRNNSIRFTEFVNTPVQGTGGDIIKLALALLCFRYHKQGVDAVPVLIVHDEIVIENRGKGGEAQEIFSKTLLDAGSLFVPDIKISAEIGAGRDWTAKP